MWAIVRHPRRNIDPTPLTPEEEFRKMKLQDEIDTFDGWLILVLGILIFGALIWAMIVS